MPSGISRAVTKVTYGVTQVPRVAWYIGYSLVLRELADTVRQREKSKARRRIHTDARVPDRKRIYADMAKLFLRDLANVEAGIYPVPADHDGSLLAMVRRSRCSSTIFLTSIDVASAMRATKSSTIRPAGLDLVITCRISTISRAAG
jgi:hypothetical protein